jgi:hypothetical protein
MLPYPKMEPIPTFHEEKRALKYKISPTLQRQKKYLPIPSPMPTILF